MNSSDKIEQHEIEGLKALVPIYEGYASEEISNPLVKTAMVERAQDILSGTISSNFPESLYYGVWIKMHLNTKEKKKGHRNETLFTFAFGFLIMIFQTEITNLIHHAFGNFTDFGNISKIVGYIPWIVFFIVFFIVFLSFVFSLTPLFDIEGRQDKKKILAGFNLLYLNGDAVNEVQSEQLSTNGFSVPPQDDN